MSNKEEFSLLCIICNYSFTTCSCMYIKGVPETEPNDPILRHRARPETSRSAVVGPWRRVRVCTVFHG